MPNGGCGSSPRRRSWKTFADKLQQLRLTRQLIIEQERRGAGRHGGDTSEHDARLAANLDAMRADARWALECWRPVQGQVALLNNQVVKKEHVTLVLDFSAVAHQMEWNDVPRRARARVWDLVLLLHDMESHDGRGYPRICIEHAYEDALVDAGCRFCRSWLGLPLERVSHGTG